MAVYRAFSALLLSCIEYLFARLFLGRAREKREKKIEGREIFSNGRAYAIFYVLRCAHEMHRSLAETRHAFWVKFNAVGQHGCRTSDFRSDV